MQWTKEKLWELQEMYSDPDYEVKEIAEHFKVSEQSIRNAAVKNLISRGTYLEQGYIRCSTCKSVLPATSENFYRNKSRKSGFHGICKECWRKYKGSIKRRTKLNDYQKYYIIKNYPRPGCSVEGIAKHLKIRENQVRNFVQNARVAGIKIGYREER